MFQNLGRGPAEGFSRKGSSCNSNHSNPGLARGPHDTEICRLDGISWIQTGL